MDAKFLRLAWEDYIKGIVVTAISAILAAALAIINTGRFPTTQELGTIGMAGVTAGVAYLIKNLLTNSKNQLFKPEPTEPAATDNK